MNASTLMANLLLKEINMSTYITIHLNTNKDEKGKFINIYSFSVGQDFAKIVNDSLNLPYEKSICLTYDKIKRVSSDIQNNIDITKARIADLEVQKREKSSIPTNSVNVYREIMNDIEYLNDSIGELNDIIDNYHFGKNLFEILEDMTYVDLNYALYIGIENGIDKDGNLAIENRED